MSVAQYRRLFLVLVIPLLVGGWFYVHPKLPTSANIVCDQSPEEQCVNWWDWSPDQHPFPRSRFSILFRGDDMDEPFYTFVSGSDRHFFSAEIVQAESRYEDADSAALLKKLEGRKAKLFFQDVNKIDKKNNEISDDYEVYLFCWGILFTQTENEFIARCDGYSWAGGDLTFILSDQRELRELSHLRESALDAMNGSKVRYRIQQILGYPVFIYAFLLFSATIWIVIKAYGFVRHGSKPPPTDTRPT